MKRIQKRSRYVVIYLVVLVLWLVYGTYGVLNAPYVGF